MSGKYPKTLGRIEAVWNKLGGEDGVDRFLSGVVRIVFSTILTTLREMKLDAQISAVTSLKYWKDAGLVWACDTFTTQFGSGLALEDAAESTYVVRKLEQKSLDAPIIAELGGEKKSESSVAHFHAFLSKNKESSEWFIFYLRGHDGNLWAVRALWSTLDLGWDVRAESVTNPHEWSVGRCIVSRKYS